MEEDEEGTLGCSWSGSGYLPRYLGSPGQEDNPCVCVGGDLGEAEELLD